LQQGSEEEYEEHANKAKTLPETTTEKNKLIIDRLYKQQSTDGYGSQIIEVLSSEKGGIVYLKKLQCYFRQILCIVARQLMLHGVGHNGILNSYIYISAACLEKK
jgi:hypothetical protein